MHGDPWLGLTQVRADHHSVLFGLNMRHMLTNGLMSAPLALLAVTFRIIGRVSDVHFTMLHAMLMPSSEGERHDTHACALPPCHTDQVMKGGKTKVHI